MNAGKVIRACFLLLLLVDLTISFCQYYHTPMDGDMAAGIVPNWDVQKILDDPFGVGVMQSGFGHPNPNRYFVHVAFKEYYRVVPAILRKFVDPVESIYLASSLLKIFIHVSLLALLTLLTSRLDARKSGRNFLLVGCIASPFFIGRHEHFIFGLIDRSNAYLFSYGVCLALCGVFLYVLFRIKYLNTSGRGVPWYYIVIMVLSGIVLPFSGPFVPATMLLGIACFGASLVFPWDSKTHKRVSNWLIGLVVITSVTCVYSLYLGTYNTIQDDVVVGYAERYEYLLVGMGTFFKISSPAAWLVLLIVLNIIILRKSNIANHGFIRLHLLIVVLSAIYLVLLPLAGYRSWRPHILRYDTSMLIMAGLIFLYSYGSIFVLNSMVRRKKLYLVFLFTVSVGLLVFDKDDFESASCERQALYYIMAATENPVAVPYECTVLRWEKVSDPGSSGLEAELLHIWGVREEPVRYFNSIP